MNSAILRDTSCLDTSNPPEERVFEIGQCRAKNIAHQPGPREPRRGGKAKPEKLLHRGN